MKFNIKFFFIIFLLFISTKLYSYEIIRDPIFEDYFEDIGKDLKLNRIEIYLVKNKSPNAFVIKDNIYITTGLLEIIENEDTIKAIYLHEYGHIIKNHFEAKNIEIKESTNKSSLYNLFSFGIAALTNNTNIAIGTSITLNSNLINEISKHSVNFEIEADDFMIKQIRKNKINTSELISFLNESNRTINNYFKTHPNDSDRINNLKELNYTKSENSKKFEWIKAKYSRKSDNQSFNIFFEKLENGIFDQDEELNGINRTFIKYEAFKKGFLIDNWDSEFKKLLTISNNPFLKLEYLNFLLDNNLEDKYNIINDLKFDKDIMNDYFYYYVYAKYYEKIDNNKLSNFYFCQFYKAIKYFNKADFFCKNYDIKDIPNLDKSYALFK